MNISKNRLFLAGVAFLLSSFLAKAEDVFVLGPVDRISKNSIAVLGQSLKFGEGQVPKELEVGAFVVVDAKGGGIAELDVSTLQFFPIQYVPGATDVALTGIVSTYDASQGYLTINDLLVYVVDALRDPNVQFVAGESVEIVGRQPQPGGLLIASTILKQTRSGSGLLRRQSVAKIGVNAQAIIGTGRSSEAIVGTGVTVQAIVGTDRSSEAIVGTGVTAQAIVATGRSTAAIVGTGISAHAVVGTGASTQAIVGTGVNRQAIAGTGRSTQAIVGTGR